MDYNTHRWQSIAYLHKNYPDIIVDGETLIVPDYVFKSDYKLESIEEHSKQMWSKKHLPAVKSAEEIKKSGGYDISERREQILEELEKAHIYIDQLNNQINGQQQQINELKTENEELKNRLTEIERLLMKE